MGNRFPPIVMTCVPLRISFAGGGTDLAEYYRTGGGEVISTTIDKFVYITVKSHGALFPDRYRLNYFDSEHADTLDEIKNDIMRECLRLVPVDERLYISTIADIPTQSGLGSSSAFAVGLLYALHIKRGDRISLGQLAEEACQVEIDMLGHPIGKQDQYAAAFGGFNHFRFSPKGETTIKPLCLEADKVRSIFDHLMLFWTSITRSSADILTEQKNATLSGRNRQHLDRIREHCRKIGGLLDVGFEPQAFGRLLDETWTEKQGLASAISNDHINHWYDQAMQNGAFGGKICGAGGGGFLLLVVPPERQPAVRRALSELECVPIRYETTGARVLLPLGQ